MKLDAIVKVPGPSHQRQYSCVRAPLPEAGLLHANTRSAADIANTAALFTAYFCVMQQCEGPVWSLIVNMLSCVWENEFCFQTLVVTRSCPQQAQWQPGPVPGPGLWLVSSASAGFWLADAPPSPGDSWPLGQSLCITCKYLGPRIYCANPVVSRLPTSRWQTRQSFKTWSFGVVGFIKISIWFIKTSFQGALNCAGFNTI